MTSYLRQKFQSFQIGSSDVKEDSLEDQEEVERSKIGIMRAVVEAQDPSAKVPTSPKPLFFCNFIFLLLINAFLHLTIL